VDEALFLADRVALMTNGPAARVGEVLEVPFPRPRNRREVMEHPDYYRLREQIVGFLERQARTGAVRPEEADPDMEPLAEDVMAVAD
jgi:ABC-type nitrate/sulfonate/bicarbonate transport system ATPase subunit